MKLFCSDRDKWSRHWLDPVSGKFPPAIVDHVGSFEKFTRPDSVTTRTVVGGKTPDAAAARVLLCCGVVVTLIHIRRLADRKHLIPDGNWPTLWADAHAFPSSATPDSVEFIVQRGVMTRQHISSFKLRSPAPKKLLESK